MSSNVPAVCDLRRRRIWRQPFAQTAS